MTDSRLSTVEANRLQEHEAAIERSLSEVGWHLRAIRDQRLYRATHDTFELYCRERWNYGRHYVNRQIAAAETIDALVPTGTTPTERQVRPLTSLPIEERAEVWDEAVDEFGESPTSDEVAAVVARRRPQSTDHPAVFSTAIVAAIVELLDGIGVTRILDPFAGTGIVHTIADKLGVDSIGVEIEREWAKLHKRTLCADSRLLTRADVGRFDAIVTSPTYGNRMADHHTARDESDRATYRHRLGRKLSAHNSGGMQWGDEYRSLHAVVYRRVVKLLEPGGMFVLNVKDHVRNGARQPVSGWHVAALLDLGLLYVDDNPVVTRGLGGAGDNAESREGIEHVYLLTKPG